MQLLLLSQENLELAKAEALSIVNFKKNTLIENFLIINAKNPDFKRLAYTKKAYELLFTATDKTINKKMQEFNWQKIYKKDFCIRTNNLKQKEKDLAGFVWNNVDKPKVNLTTPKTMIELFKIQNNIYCCLLLYKNKENFESRKAHKKPHLYPTSLHPKLARAIVNLTGAKDKVIDPFCGTGGILIEAGLINLKTEGYDINKNLIEMAKENIKHYKIKNCKLTTKDALKIKKKLEFIATDLPYSKNTKDVNINKLYTNFFKLLKKQLKKKAVIGMQSTVNSKKLIKDSRLKLIKEFSYYIHKSMTKKIIIIENGK